MITRYHYNKHNRLRTNADFQHVFTNQVRSFHSRYFVLLLAHTHLPDVRFGVVVSKKTSKKAVMRNCLKRYARETFRHHRPHICTLLAEHGVGYDLVCIARKGIAPIASEPYYDSLHHLFSQCIAFIEQDLGCVNDNSVQSVH